MSAEMCIIVAMLAVMFKVVLLGEPKKENN